MDVLTALQSQGGTIGLGVGLTAVIVWLFRSLYLERKGRDADVARLSAEIKRLNEDHDAELAELRTELARLRESQNSEETRWKTEIDRLNTRLDAEMELRRQIQYGRPGGLS